MNTPIAMIQFFAKYIEQALGIVYQEANFYQLETRLMEVAKQTDHETISSLYESCQHGVSPQIRNLLLDLATNNETSFFRDAHIFDVLHELCMNRLRENPNWQCRIWSTACSFGQEIYSIAMTLKKVQQVFPNFKFTILATDIADRALKRAEEGIYNDLEVGRGLGADLKNRYFEQVQTKPINQWQVKTELKQNIKFQKQNLLDPFGALGQFDLIFCRNVLIYQSVDNKKAIVSKLLKCMHPDAIFFMGAAESLIGISDKLTMVRKDKVTFYVNDQHLKKAC